MKKRKFGGSAGGSKYRVDLECTKPRPKFIQKLRQQADQQDITLENKLRKKPEIEENENGDYDIENAQILAQDEENKFQETEAFIKQQQISTTGETEDKFDKEQFRPTFHKKTNLFIQKQEKMNRKLNFKASNSEKEIQINQKQQQDDKDDKEDKEREKQELIGKLMKKGNMKIQKSNIINNKLEDQIKKKVKNNLLSFADIDQ